MTLVYTIESCPTRAESLAASALAGKVRFRNGRHFRGDLEPCDMVVTDRADIRKAYHASGVKVRKVSTLAERAAKLDD